MKITLIHQISETERHLFEFEVDNCIRYNAFFKSYRDDENDIWGDEWQEKHKEQESAAWEKINEMLDNGARDWDYEICELKKDLRNKYWPTCCKTKRGEVRYSGQSGGKMPEYPWNEGELKDLIIQESSKLIKEMAIY